MKKLGEIWQKNPSQPLGSSLVANGSPKKTYNFKRYDLIIQIWKIAAVLDSTHQGGSETGLNVQRVICF